MTFRKSLNGLNPRHLHLSNDLKVAIMAGEPVDYAFYWKYKETYSSKTLKVRFNCEVCGGVHESDFKSLNKRKLVTAAVCSKCVMKVVATNEEWRKHNSQAQLKIQSTPEQKRKNAAGVSKFWADNPEKLSAMREKVMAANKSEEAREKLRNRKSWNGRGISGNYLSIWGWISFDSSYELQTLLALEADKTVKTVKRGPVIQYEFEGSRQYFVDYEVLFDDGVKWWIEVKSGYIGKRRENIEKLRAKLSSALNLIRLGHADKMLMITENNSEEILGVKMPRSSRRAAMFRECADKIVFSKHEDEEKYK